MSRSRSKLAAGIALTGARLLSAVGVDNREAGPKISARGVLYVRPRPKMAGEARANLRPDRRAAIGPMQRCDGG